MDDCSDGSLPIWNLTDEVAAKALLYSPSEAFIISVFYPITVVLGLGGNLAFLYVVFHIKRMHTITNTYLSHLAFSDIIYVGLNSLIIYTYVLSPVRYNTFVQSSLRCYFLVFPIYIAYVSGICIVTLVTYERYHAIVNPLSHRGISSKSRTRKLLAFSWSTSALVAVGAAFIFGTLNRYCALWPDNEEYEDLPTIIQFCAPFHPDMLVFCELCKSVPFFIAMFLNIYMYARILYALSTEDKSLGKSGGGGEGDGMATMQASRFRNQVARMLVVNGSLFFICQIWTRIASIDAIVLSIFGEGILTPNQYNAILSLSRRMLFVNGLINPFVYNATSSEYRKAFRDTFCFCRKMSMDGSRSVSNPTTLSSLSKDSI